MRQGHTMTDTDPRIDLEACREALRDSEAEVTRLVSGLRKVYALAETEHETLDRAGISDAAYEALMDTGHDIYDDGAPQDGGATDPHDTSGPPITEDQQRGFETLARWTNMHHMTPSREGMARIDNGHPVPDVLDAECARLVTHECGWQTQRFNERAAAKGATS